MKKPADMRDRIELLEIVKVMREQLRKAGRALLDADAAYANKLYSEKMPEGMQIGHAMPIEQAASYVQLPPNPTEEQPILGTIARHGANAGLVAANVAARYALPAGGVTLAGAGLIDLASKFGGAADYPEEQQLTLG